MSRDVDLFGEVSALNLLGRRTLSKRHILP